MMRSRAAALASFVMCVLTVGTACANGGSGGMQTGAPAGQAGNHAADEAAIRGLDSAWVKAAVAKNVDQAASYYATDAVLMAPGAPMATGKDAIRAAFAGMMALPGFALTFAPDKITVGADLAYDVGSYALTMNDKAGKPQTSNGKYVVVWGKQPDGSWKVVLDAPTTTQ
jgi:uncharacterized protein (TIGR02246 family)